MQPKIHKEGNPRKSILSVSHIRQKVQLYLRYADDIFLYGQVLKTNYSNLYQKTNEVHPSINLDFNYSKTQIYFFTYKNRSIEKILTTLYRNFLKFVYGFSLKQISPAKLYNIAFVYLSRLFACLFTNHAKASKKEILRSHHEMHGCIILGQIWLELPIFLKEESFAKLKCYISLRYYLLYSIIQLNISQIPVDLNTRIRIA